MSLPGGEPEPYTGPPPTGPYGAPPRVPGAGGGWAPVPWPPAPAPWPPAPGPWPPGTAPAGWAPAPAGWAPAPAGWGALPPWPPAGRQATPPVGWDPPPGTPPHDVPQPYLEVMRSRTWRWWRPLLGLLLIAVVFSVADIVVVLVALLTGISPDLALPDLTDPVVLLVTNVTLILAIPTVWLAWGVVHGMGIGWSSSVLGRLRPRLFAPLTVRALATIGAGIVLSVLIGLAADGWGGVTGPVRSYGWLVVVVLLTTPLQSAAEEYVFRGYLSQAIAGWIRRPRAGAVVAAVVTAALFSAAHAPPDLVTFLDRFLVGLAASAVVWLTGGLEAAIVLHAVNNVLIFLLAGALGEGVATGEVGAAAWLAVLIDVLAMAGYVAVVAASRRRLAAETVSPALDLRVPGPHPDRPTAPAPAAPGGW